jgi:DNA-binding CsgD family transcriptional regulator
VVDALRAAKSAPSVLSAREREILGLVAAGMTADEIAERLVLSSHTVETHVRNSVRKLGARGRLHAVVLALQNGEIQPDSA